MFAIASREDVLGAASFMRLLPTTLHVSSGKCNLLQTHRTRANPNTTLATCSG